MNAARSIWQPSRGSASARSRPASSAILVSETTGEASTLTPAEQETIVRAAVDDRAGPRPRHCRRRIQFDQSGDRAGAARRSGRRRRGAFGGALLQQADAGRHPGAFSGRLRSRPRCRSSCTTFHPGPCASCPMTRCCGSPASKQLHRVEGWNRRHHAPDAACGRCCRAGFDYCPATTQRHWPSSPMAGTVASPCLERRAGAMPGRSFRIAGRDGRRPRDTCTTGSCR